MAGDTHYSDVTLLLHCNGTDGSTTFTDTSSSPKTVTVNGDAQIDTAVSKFGGAAALFDGTGDYLDLVKTPFDLVGTDFTIEGWFYTKSLATLQMLVANRNTTGYSLFIGTDGSVSFQGDSSFISSAASTINLDTWTFIAVSRIGSTTKLFVGGTQVASGTVSFTSGNASALMIGRNYIGATNAYYFNGSMDDLRITEFGRYASDFAPPTAQFADFQAVLSISGFATTTLTPAAVMHKQVRHSKSGAVTVTATPTSGMHKQVKVSVTGGATVVATPAASMHKRLQFSFAGAVPLTFTAASAVAKRHRTIVGVVANTVTPVATLYLHPRLITAEFGFITSSLSSSVFKDGANAASLGFIATTLTARAGVTAALGFIDTTLSSTVTSVTSITASLSFFTSSLSGNTAMESRITSETGFISSTLTSYGGAEIAFNTPMFSMAATATNDATRITASLGFLETSLSVSGIMHARSDVAFGFLEFDMPRLDIALAAPIFELSCSVTESQANAIAYVMNVKTTESTTYTNYPFMHIIHIGGKPYGVVSDGLFLLEGATDNGTAINGTLTTKETDFGVFNSKSVEAVYLNSDTATTIRPTVDGVQAPIAYPSSFGGRKVEMARGLEGRYWKFQINNIQKLEGLEISPHLRQRRVK